MALLEVACFNPESALIAYEAGADRIELCDDRESGGTTPPLSWLTTLKRQLAIPIFVMIRPRGGDFNYNSKEFSQMKAEIDGFKPYADGYVFGILNAERRVDVSRTASLVELAKPLPCTFHKAFDEASDIFEALENVIAAGCSTILTSGGAASAHTGRKTLRQLVQTAQQKVTIMPGGNLRTSNIPSVRAYSRASIFHSSAVLKGTAVPSTDEIRKLKMLLQDDYLRSPSDSKPPSPTETQSSEDDETVSDMLMSAVSIGATPVEERRHGFSP